MTHRFRPTVDLLQGRTLPSAGVTATLSQGILTIHRADASTAVAVDVMTRPGPHHSTLGQVVVEGVARYSARRVRMIDLDPGASTAGVTIRQSTSAPVTVNMLAPKTVPPAATPPAPSPAPTSSTTQVLISDETGVISAIGQQIVDLTNAQRAAAGLPALAVNPRLVLAAQIHAHDMARLDDMEHTLTGVALATLQDRANFVGYQYAWLGENIAEGFADANAVMAGWMNSPEHKANILQWNFTEIGVAVAADANGTLYFSVEFGSKQA